jgi:hypothetical protein
LYTKILLREYADVEIEDMWEETERTEQKEESTGDSYMF